MIVNLSQLFTSSLELVVLEVAVVIALVLAIIVYTSDKKNATAKIFVLLSLSAVLWLIAAYHQKMLLKNLIFNAKPKS